MAMAALADRAVTRRRAGHEILVTVLLAVAAVATAWSSYQATRWNGEQAQASARTTAIRLRATRAAGRANAETEVDVATFIQWVNADRTGAADLASYYMGHFRPEFRSAFVAWQAETTAFKALQAPPTPFAMPQYQVASQKDAQRLDYVAEDSATEVRIAVQRASNYVLTVVLYAVSFFFAGMSNHVTRRPLRIVMIAMACAVVLGTLAWTATFPVSIRNRAGRRIRSSAPDDVPGDVGSQRIVRWTSRAATAALWRRGP